MVYLNPDDLTKLFGISKRTLYKVLVPDMKRRGLVSYDDSKQYSFREREVISYIRQKAVNPDYPPRVGSLYDESIGGADATDVKAKIETPISQGNIPTRRLV